MSKHIQSITCLCCSGTCKRKLHNLFDDRYGSKGLFDIFVCTTCGFGKLHPVMTIHKNSLLYKTYYPMTFTLHTTVSKNNYLRMIKEVIKWLIGDISVKQYIKKGDEVLDIGCGSGQSLIDIQQSGGIAYGVEPNPNAQIIAKKYALKIFKGTIDDNPFPKKSFDKIIASQVIEHISNPKIFLQNVKKRLKQKGEVILAFPNCNSAYRKVFGQQWIHWHVPYHCNFFTYPSFVNLVGDLGFTIVSKKTITPNLWTLLQIKAVCTKNKIGKPNPVWNSKLYDNKIIGLCVTARDLLIQILFIPINRMVDLLGQGESFIVILKSEK